jgi:hypothetical protein
MWPKGWSFWPLNIINNILETGTSYLYYLSTIIKVIDRQRQLLLRELEVKKIEHRQTLYDKAIYRGKR